MSQTSDYERMRQTLGILATERWKIDAGDPVHPVRVLDEMAKRSPANARNGLRMAINDFVEDLVDASQQDIEQLDRHLIAGGGMTIGEIRAQFSKKLKATLRRGTIKTEQEYYLVRNAVEFADAETAVTMWSLLSAFEAQITK